jgi:hypothetical protein
MLSFRNEPLHYRIFPEGLVEKEPYLAIDIVDSAVKRLGGEIHSRVIADLVQQFQFTTPFQGKLESGHSFGFDWAGSIINDGKGYVRLKFLLPVVEEETGVCERCNGKKLLPDEKVPCGRCEGIGKHYRIAFRQARAISASCAVLFASLHRLFSIEENRCGHPPFQLLHVRTAMQGGNNGYAVQGEFSAPLVKWLASCGKDALHSIPIVLMLAHGKMLPLTFARHRQNEYRVVVGRKGWLDLAFPGDGCGLHPAATSITENLGYEFTSRNVDEPWQQIALLIALGTLTSTAMEAGVHHHV